MSGDFVAVDVETANADLGSICSIGLVRFRDGEITQQLGYLIDPQDEFDPLNVAIHGIGPEQVAGAPTMGAMYPALVKVLAGRFVVHHTHFDRVAIHRAGAHFGYGPLDCTWLDSARVARMAWPRFALAGFGLGNLASEFGIAFEHHDAVEDARCAGLILLRAIAETGTALADWPARLEASPYGERSSPRAGDPDGPLVGEVVVFTGRLSMPRGEAADMAAAIGCRVATSVSSKTTLLVVGDEDVRLLRGYDKSQKHRAAEGLIAAGSELRILRESDFTLLVAIVGP